jgi:hypothetical protein
LVVLVALVLVVVGVYVYEVIEVLMRFERLEIFRFFGWTANSDGEIRQVSFHLFNNGTRDLEISKVWVNGTLMSNREWGWRFGPMLDAKTGEWVFIAPQEVVFECGKSYNFTIGTSSGNRFPLIIRVDEESVKPENLTIIDWHFGKWPPLSGKGIISVRVKNLGETTAIVTRVEVNGTIFNKKMWVPAQTRHAVIVDYGWRVGTYLIHIETAAGNTYEITATAEYP